MDNRLETGAKWNLFSDLSKQFAPDIKEDNSEQIKYSWSWEDNQELTRHVK